MTNASYFETQFCDSCYISRVWANLAMGTDNKIEQSDIESTLLF